MLRCQGSLQIDGGCVAQDVKGRIASRTYTNIYVYTLFVLSQHHHSSSSFFFSFVHHHHHSSSSSSPRVHLFVVFMIHYHIIMASLVSPFLDLIIVVHYLLVKTWFSLVLKTRKVTQLMLTYLSVV